MGCECNIDRGFMEQLKAMDERLGACFDPDAEKILITYRRASGQDVPVYIVQTEEGEFRQPDGRDLQALRESDGENITPKQRIEKTAKYFEEYQAKQRNATRAMILERTLDDKHQLRRTVNQIYNRASGKAGQHVRKLSPRARGKVF